jgi:predicted porin
MKKTLLCTTVLAAFSSSALAETNATVYGIVDAGVAYRNDGNPAGKTLSMESGQQSGSRLGFRGTEDLGGGLSAIFTLENGFSIDTGTAGQGGRLFGRQAWVGLAGNFGNVKVGRQQTILYYAMDQLDPFHINLAGNSQKIFGYGTYAADPFQRSDNTITYTTPKIANVIGTVSYGLGEQPGNYSANRNLGAGLSYVNGPLNLQFSYQKADTVAAPSSLAGGNASAIGDNRATLIGGVYDFGLLKAHLAYADNRLSGATGGGKDRNFLAGVTVPVGAAGSLLASWIRNDVRDIADGKSDLYAVGYSYAISKRTNVYTSYSYLKNGDGVALNTYKDAQYGASVRLFNVGMRHQF